MRRRFFLGGLAGALLLAAGAANAQQPVKIRVSYAVPVSNWATLIAEKLDLAKHHGKSYTFEAVRYQGTPPMITALANNELEIANLAYSSLGLAIQNAGLDDLRVISDEFQDGVEGRYSSQFFVLKDGPIKKVSDLKGKVIATNAAGSGIDIAMKILLRKNGLEERRDYTVVEAPFPAMAAMLFDKKVDMIPAVLPFSINPELQAKAIPLAAQKDGLGKSQMIMWTARKSFTDKNRAAMVDFMEDTIRIIRWYLDPKNKDEVLQIASKLTKAPPERFAWLFSQQDYYRDPNFLPDLKALQTNMDAVKDLGIISSTLNVEKYSDLSIVKEAAARLK